MFSSPGEDFDDTPDQQEEQDEYQQNKADEEYTVLYFYCPQDLIRIILFEWILTSPRTYGDYVLQ